MDERKAAREAAAKAVAEVIRDAFDRKARPVTDVSDAAIDAYEAALKGAGWVIVPREPTTGMFRALTASWPEDEASLMAIGRWALGSFVEDYAAMIAASEASELPPPPASRKE